MEKVTALGRTCFCRISENICRPSCRSPAWAQTKCSLIFGELRLNVRPFQSSQSFTASNLVKKHSFSGHFLTFAVLAQLQLSFFNTALQQGVVNNFLWRGSKSQKAQKAPCRCGNTTNWGAHITFQLSCLKLFLETHCLFEALNR